MLKKLLLAGAALATLWATPGQAQTLKLGHPAPKLQVKSWVKGKPVSALAKGNVYVVEFWATWCGPCRSTIPHLTQLQKKYPDVTFIGVSVWEQDQSAVAPFVRDMGAKMDYRVALDAVPAGGDGYRGKMALNWMSAAGQSGIPASFLVDKEGRIAWIGHPQSLDVPLSRVVAGKWDLKAAQAEQNREIQERKKLQGLASKLAAAQRSGDVKGSIRLLGQAIQEKPELEPALGMERFRLMLMPKGDPAQASVYGKRLMDRVYTNNKEALNQLAWLIVGETKTKPQPALAALALRAAQRADQLGQGRDAPVVDTLARAYFMKGDARKAVIEQERAIRLAAGTQLANDPGLKKRLAEYRAAAAR